MSKTYITSKEDYRLSIEKEWIDIIQAYKITIVREIIGQGEGTTELYLSATELDILATALSK
jgi:hypothetical protein